MSEEGKSSMLIVTESKNLMKKLFFILRLNNVDMSVGTFTAQTMNKYVSGTMKSQDFQKVLHLNILFSVRKLQKHN